MRKDKGFFLVKCSAFCGVLVYPENEGSMQVCSQSLDRKEDTSVYIAAMNTIFSAIAF